MNKKVLRVGEHEAAPGRKVAGYQSVSSGDNEVALPVFLINGPEVGPTLSVTAGVHGAEGASIEAALRLGRSLEPDTVSGQVIILPLVNPAGFRRRLPGVNPQDGKNIGRQFPGNPNGSISERIADWIFREVIRPADCYVDMHGGDLFEALLPFTMYHVTGNEELDRKTRTLAEAYGSRYVLRTEISGASYVAAASAGVSAVAAEAGMQGIVNEADVAAHLDGLNRLMLHQRMLAGPVAEPVPTQHMKGEIILQSEQEGFFYPTVHIGDFVTRGEVLGSITDFTGRVLDEVVAPADGYVLLLMTSLAISEGDLLLSVSVPS
jgi:uncharacterized protein